jgi:hypothetical protein
MASTVIRGGSISINYVDAPTASIDLSCYTVALEITPSTEDIDVGTFCAPTLQDQGRTTFTAVLSLLWEPALYTLLQPYIGRVGNLIAYATGAVDKNIKFSTRFVAQPWGRFEIGQRVEVELPLAVLDTPVMVTNP